MAGYGSQTWTGAGRIQAVSAKRQHGPCRCHLPWLGLLALTFTLCGPSRAGDILEPRPDGSRRARYALPEDDQYRSPLRMLLSRDGKRLFVSCEETNDVAVVDLKRKRVEKRIQVGRLPFDLVESPDGRLLYVSNRWDSSISVVDLKAMREIRTIPSHEDPHGLFLDPRGTRLFVANSETNELCILDTTDGSEIKKLSMGSFPFGVAADPAGRTLYVSNQYSSPVPFRTAPILELTVVDLDEQLVRERRRLSSSVVAQGVAVSPDGWFVATATEFPKNLIPETQIYQGWMVTYGFALTETRPGGRTAYLLIDEPNLYFADPYGIAFSPDGRYLYLSSSGVDVVTFVDVQAVYDLLRVRDGRIGITDDEIRRYARDLGLSTEYVVARVPTGNNPKDLAVSPDGRWLYVADRLADQITVIDIEARRAVEPIDLGGPGTVTPLRHGARLFNYASISFQKQLSCATCHPEEHVDGLVYDIAVDGGMGRNLVDNLSLRGIAETAPFKWTGKNPNLQRQEGPRAAQLFFRTHGFEAEDREAIVEFIESIPVRPNHHHSETGELNEFQRLGKKMFERAYDNLGRYIPVANRCTTCHPLPFGTDRRKHDIGSRNDHDWDGVFDTPHLTNVHERPPFMHDGRCYSLEEIWTRFNPDDTHGVTNDMTKDQLNGLIEYLKLY